MLDARDVINELFRSKPKPKRTPMKLFNAFQIVSLFAGMPFLLTWLATKPIPHSNSAFWAAAVVYVVAFIVHVVSVRNAMAKDGWLDF